MRIKASMLSLFTVAALSAGAANANLITNGNFDTVTHGTNLQLTSGTTTTTAGRTTLTGWNSAKSGASDGYNFVLVNSLAAGNTSIKQIKNYTASANGGNLFASDAVYGPGVLSQTVNNLIVGTTYILTFEYAVGQQAGFSGANPNDYWQVGFGSSTANTAMLSISGDAFSGWQTASMAFVASSTSQLLSFLAKGGTTGAPPFMLLDGVSMDAKAIPEPSTISLLLAGIGLVAFAARRRNRQA
jgi:hypothetical protein